MEKVDVSVFFPDWLRHNFMPIESLDVNPVRPILATGGWDKKVQIWNLMAIFDRSIRQEKLITTISEHTENVNCVRWSPDGQSLATCGDDNKVCICRKTNREPLGAEVEDMLSDKGKQAMKPSERWVTVVLNGHKHDVKSVTWAADGKTVVSGSIDGEVMFWNARTREMKLSIMLGTGVKALSCDPIGRLLAAQELSGSLSLFDMKGTLCSRIDECLTRDVERSSNARIAWSPDGSFVCGSNGFSNRFIVPFYSRADSSIAFTFEGHIGPIPVVSFAPTAVRINGRAEYFVATGDTTGLIAVWTIGSGSPRPICILSKVSQEAVNDISWFPDSSGFVASVSSDNLRSKGGVIGFKLRGDVSFEPMSSEEMLDMRMRVLNETRDRSEIQSRPILKGILDEEPEEDVSSMSQISTETINLLQIETVNSNGMKVIKPVLISDVLKKAPSFTIFIGQNSAKEEKFLLNDERLSWPLDAVLSGKPTHVILCGSFVWAAANGCLFVLSSKTGRRVHSPRLIGGKCKALLGNDQIVLAVGCKCFLFSAVTGNLMKTVIDHEDFIEYDISCWPMLIGRSWMQEWSWCERQGIWIGGVERPEYGDIPVSVIVTIAAKTSGAALIWEQASAERRDIWTNHGNQPSSNTSSLSVP